MPPIQTESPKVGRPPHITAAGKRGSTDQPSLEAKLCLLPSPINGYLIYASMGVISCIWIFGTHYSCWRRLRKPVHIELDNLAKEEEDLRDQQHIGKCGWRRDIDGIVRDCVSLFIFIFIGFVLQIIGVY
jgi:hypothetical protein